MATARSHMRINRPAHEVWKAVSDAGAISKWFPGIETSSATATTRSCVMAGGATIEEEIVTNDSALRRFQYRITEGPMPVDFHLGTVDVLEDGEGALVIYSTDITPDEGAAMIGPASEGALKELKRMLEEN